MQFEVDKYAVTLSQQKNTTNPRNHLRSHQVKEHMKLFVKKSHDSSLKVPIIVGKMVKCSQLLLFLLVS